MVLIRSSRQFRGGEKEGAKRFTPLSKIPRFDLQFLQPVRHVFQTIDDHMDHATFLFQFAVGDPGR